MNQIRNIKCKFETEGTIKEDITSYGNRFYIQLEDNKYNDHTFLRVLANKKYKLIIFIEEESNE